MLFGLTRSKLADAPITGEHAKYYKRLARMSAAFAFVADLTMLFMGGALKRKEKLSGRFADALTYMFICSAVLKRYEDTGRPPADAPLMEWSVKYSLYQVQYALDEILRNFPSQLVGQIIRGIVFPFGRRFRAPNDALGQRVAAILMSPSEARDRLTEGIYIVDDPDDITGKLEYALEKIIAADPVENRLRENGLCRRFDSSYDGWIASLLGEQHITQDEAECLLSSHAASRNVVKVDDFAPGTL